MTDKTPMDIRATINKIVSEHLGVPQDKIKDDSDLVNDLGADSLDLIELVIAGEEAFDIKISEEEADKLTTVSSIVDLVVVKTTQKV